MTRKNQQIIEKGLTIIGWVVIIFAVYAIGKLIGLW